MLRGWYQRSCNKIIEWGLKELKSKRSWRNLPVLCNIADVLGVRSKIVQLWYLLVCAESNKCGSQYQK